MLGVRIKQARKALGLTMKQFAEPLGLSESAISRIESGSANPSEGAIKLMCAVYHLDYFWLTEGRGEMFVNDSDVIIEELAKIKGWNSETVDLLKKLFSLPTDKFNLVMDLIDTMKSD